jgi:hypothetical protein
MEVIKRITEKFDKDGNVVERITEEMADLTDRIQTQPIYVPYQPYYPYVPNTYPSWWTYTNGTVTISNTAKGEMGA